MDKLPWVILGFVLFPCVGWCYLLGEEWWRGRQQRKQWAEWNGRNR